MSDDEYPTEEELEQIRQWKIQTVDDGEKLLEFVKSIWWMPSFGWLQREGRYHLSTGGWSGNEEIIAALKENAIFWLMYWESSNRGGHYCFELLG
jgi:hypothetical protein